MLLFLLLCTWIRRVSTLVIVGVVWTCAGAALRYGLDAADRNHFGRHVPTAAEELRLIGLSLAISLPLGLLVQAVARYVRRKRAERFAALPKAGLLDRKQVLEL